MTEKTTEELKAAAVELIKIKDSTLAKIEAVYRKDINAAWAAYWDAVAKEGA